ncbi:hypothetical protein GCM10023317_09490 [Actinopolymorpha pittospori]
MATAPWHNTTHDWAVRVDLAHLTAIRQDPAGFAPTGAIHLSLEVLAYVADEAACGHGGGCRVSLFPDGSISIADDGRGTDTRRDPNGLVVKKPVLSSKDIRFFDSPRAQLLPDGHSRRGMSVVAALSGWLVHVNRRDEGSWSQRYEHGVPVTDLLPISDDEATGTTVHFRPDPRLLDPQVGPDEISRLATAWASLNVETRDLRL